MEIVTWIAIKFKFFSEETNYQVNYYVSDVLLGLSCILTIWLLDVQIEKGKSQSLASSARTMFNPAFILLILMVLWFGIANAISGNYVPVYLQNSLGATSGMIGK